MEWLASSSRLAEAGEEESTNGGLGRAVVKR